MKLGVIGKPQCGKTTIFNAASGQQAAVGDFSQSSHRAVIKVPDGRLVKLGEITSLPRIIHAEIEFLDAPGFTGKGKEAGELEVTPELREMDALMMVIDHYSSPADAAQSVRDLGDEMILADQVVVESNIDKKSRKMKLTGDKSLAAEIELLRKCLGALEKEQPLIDTAFSEGEMRLLCGYGFLSIKPVLVVLNISEDDIQQTHDIRSGFAYLVEAGKRDVAVICGKIEMELGMLEGEDRRLFMDDLGIETPAVEKVIRKSYQLLGLISFFTIGDKEVRAWSIRVGTTALKAAGAVHSDMERGFIRAEVTRYEDYVEYKTPAALKAAGKTRLEGKEYVVQDGDQILFRFNV